MSEEQVQSSSIFCREPSLFSEGNMSLHSTKILQEKDNALQSLDFIDQIEDSYENDEEDYDESQLSSVFKSTVTITPENFAIEMCQCK